jgi:hypothetical protein
LPPSAIGAERAKQALRLRTRLVELALGDRVGDDAGAGAQADRVALDRQPPDQDVEIEIAVAVEIAERARVRAAADAFELGDDLHAAHLRAARDRAARKHGGHDRARRRVGAEPSAHVRDDVMHVRVALDGHQLIDFDRARHRDAAEVVAFQVDQHDVLGALFRMADQLTHARRVVVALRARTRAGDRARLHELAADFDEPLGRGACDRPAFALHEAGERRGIRFAERRVDRSG